jgi:hypothetical protein
MPEVLGSSPSVTMQVNGHVGELVKPPDCKSGARKRIGGSNPSGVTMTAKANIGWRSSPMFALEDIAHAKAGETVSKTVCGEFDSHTRCLRFASV